MPKKDSMSSGQVELCDVKVDVLIKHKSRRKGKSVEELSVGTSETSRDVDSDATRQKSRRDRSSSHDGLEGGRRKKRDVERSVESVGAIQARRPETESSDDSVDMRDHKKRRNYDTIDHGVANVHVMRHKKRLAVADLSDEEANMVRQQRRRRDEHSGTSSDPTRHKQRRNTHSAGPYEGTTKGKPKTSSKSTDYVYVNNAYVGSLNSVNEGRCQQPITSTYREQYWACSKWSHGKKILAIGIGVLLGMSLVGGIITLALIITGQNPDEIIGPLLPGNNDRHFALF
ncbi:uncharacterized protein LOC111352284 [Spodoptera litura]|uniref:Uncharacterized protein LOC111352284 n=1 Tax=Spodoptera litura TaxID=69820 RepID=A0A9J7IMK1_SPOLT|nr:uncharacterized protein LOC111352284 [Spodoptera litura]